MKQCQVGAQTKQMIQLGHPWVIADRYTRQWPQVSCGEVISLVDENRQVLATALCDPEHRIVARLLPGRPQSITPAWLKGQVSVAARLRDHADLRRTDCYRLVHAEADGLPGLTLDRYADFCMLQLYTAAWEPWLDELKAAIVDVFAPAGLYLKYRPQQTRKLEAKGRGTPRNRLLHGAEAPTPLKVRESGLDFGVQLHKGLHTGLFPDQRRNRQEVMAHSSDREVLNLFAFTGAFSVAAAAAGARRVTSIDVSEKYLTQARDNFRLNSLDPDLHEWIVGDVFVQLAVLHQQKRRFDMVIFDPPSFSTTKKSRFATQGGTAQLVTAALGLLLPGGLMVCSSNHQKVTLEDYCKELRRGALAANRGVRPIFVGGEAEDFPGDVCFPEGRYLKFVICFCP